MKLEALCAVVLMVLASCGGQEVFACSDDSSCPDGQCESNGYCSFPDEDCSSGRRYGDFSGPFSGQCVMATDGATSGTPGTGGGSESGQASSGTASGSATTSGTTPGGSTGGSSDGTADTGPTPTCPAGQSCFDIPDGWLGPVNLYSPEQSCGDVVAEGAQAYSGEWSCACSCETDEFDSCDQATVQLQLFEEGGCQGPAALSVDLTASCQDFGGGETYSILTTAQGPAPCDSSATLDAEPVMPTDSLVLCDAFEGSTCGSGACTSNREGLCIHAEGERECPDGFERTLLYTGFEDGRGCSACACEAEYECEGSYTLANQGCGNSGSLTLQLGCTGFMTSVLGGQTASLTDPPTVDCTSSGGTPMGEIVPAQPRTICCAP